MRSIIFPATLTFVLITVASSAIAQTNLSQLIAQLQSADWTARSQAFQALSMVGFGSSDQLTLAVIGLLTLENDDVASNTITPGPVSDNDESYAEYYGDVIAAVARLNDPRSITALVGAIKTGNIAMDAIANFGTNALSQVVQQLSSTDPMNRSSAALTIGKMIDANLVSDAFSRATIGSALAVASTDPDYYVGLFSAASIAKLSQSQPATSPLSGSQCNGFYNGAFNGNVTVSAGEDCIFVNGGVTGNIQVSGGNLVVYQSYVGGNVQVNGAASFTISTGSTVKGNLQIQNLATSAGRNDICGTTVNGNLQFQNSGTAVEIGAVSGCPGNTIGGNLQVMNNGASTVLFNNTVTGNLQDQNNTAPTQVAGNRVGGNLQVENNTASTQVSNNIVTGNLQCQSNTSITGGGNTARQKQDQCASF
ncbi:MAG TPA: hypothetical protein VIY49_39755 [Bryobacteraceae bacterium]